MRVSARRASSHAGGMVVSASGRMPAHRSMRQTNSKAASGRKCFSTVQSSFRRFAISMRSAGDNMKAAVRARNRFRSGARAGKKPAARFSHGGLTKRAMFFTVPSRPALFGSKSSPCGTFGGMTMNPPSSNGSVRVPIVHMPRPLRTRLNSHVSCVCTGMTSSRRIRTSCNSTESTERSLILGMGI